MPCDNTKFELECRTASAKGVGESGGREVSFEWSSLGDQAGSLWMLM